VKPSCYITETRYFCCYELLKYIYLCCIFNCLFGVYYKKTLFLFVRKCEQIPNFVKRVAEYNCNGLSGRLNAGLVQLDCGDGSYIVEDITGYWERFWREDIITDTGHDLGKRYVIAPHPEYEFRCRHVHRLLYVPPYRKPVYRLQSVGLTSVYSTAAFKTDMKCCRKRRQSFHDNWHVTVWEMLIII